jgi:hypothetical protein
MEIQNLNIPIGPYCYEHIGPTTVKGIGIKLCPYWSCQEKNGLKIARCSLLNRDSEDGDPFNLIWDQVKECRINEDFGEGQG